MIASCDVAALGRARDPLDGLDPNDRRDNNILEAMIGLAEIFLHGLGIETACDLLCSDNRESAASDFDEPSALKFVLEQFALGLCALQDGVGMAKRVGERRIGKVVKAGWGYGRDVGSLGHG
jgi:hypothetical protein